MFIEGLAGKNLSGKTIFFSPGLWLPLTILQIADKRYRFKSNKRERLFPCPS